MSEQRFQEARKNLAFSQQLMDQTRKQNMAQPQDEMEEVSGETLMEEEVVEQPMEEEVNVAEPVAEEVVEEPKKEAIEEEKKPEKSDTADELIGVIKDMVETDRLEEERRIKELEVDHEKDLKTITDRVKALFTRGKRK